MEPCSRSGWGGESADPRPPSAALHKNRALLTIVRILPYARELSAMRFIYKINSAYDGFTPAKIPARLLAGKRIKLGWNRYVDVVDPGHEVWVYFRGPHRFEPGVYIK